MANKLLAPVEGRKSTKDFIAKFNTTEGSRERLIAGLKQLGKEGWSYEREFIRMCKLDQTRFAQLRESGEFKDHFFELRAGANKKRVWCGTKAYALKLRGMIQ